MSHDTTPAGAAARTSTVARRTTLIVLTLIATVQFFDRALMVVVMEPIKSEFALSDSQLGLLAGFSYAAAFALAGIPLGWVADRTNRRNLWRCCSQYGARWWHWLARPAALRRW